MANKYDVFIGSYGNENEETIYWLNFDPEVGKLIKVSAISGIDNPSFVLLNHAKTHLYAVSEVDEGEVISYLVDYQNKSLTELNRQPTKGGPCFLEIDKSDRYLFTANYGGGSVIVHPLAEDGTIQADSDFIDYGSEAKKVGLTSHVHAIKNIPNTNKYVATDLGLDKLYVYELDSVNGKLNELQIIDTPKNGGPRHLEFHEERKMMYILNQDDSTVLVYSYDEADENFKRRQVLPALLDDFEGVNYGADIHLTESGKYLYVSNRGHHSITAYEVIGDGTLEPVSNSCSVGDWPRNFAISPEATHILVANEHTDEINVMTIREDGSMKDTGNKICIPKPVCVNVVV